MKGHTSGPELLLEELESPGQGQHFKSASHCRGEGSTSESFLLSGGPAVLCCRAGEISSTACAQRRGSFIREEGERCLEPVVRDSFPARGEGAAGTQALSSDKFQ